MAVVEGWFDQPEVTAAEEEAGHDPATFLEALIRKVDARTSVTCRKVLDRHGVSVGELIDMRIDSYLNEHPAEAGGGVGLAHGTTRENVRQLFLSSFSPEQIAGILDVEVERVQTYIEQRRMNDRAPQVLELHRQGKTPLEISRLLDLSRSWVHRTIVSTGEQPNVRVRKVPSSLRDMTVALRREGLTQGQIVEATGLELEQVKGILRSAKKKGQL